MGSLRCLILLMLLDQCQYVPEVMYDRDLFKLENEGMTYKDDLFTGRLIRLNKRTRHVLPYLNGKIHGTAKVIYNRSGRLAKLMPYIQGKKTGLHRGYYPSGARRFEAHFLDDRYDGESIQWYENGQIYSYTLYEKGKLVGHKLWRKNGRIYANYVYKNGRKLGLDGGKLCLPIKDSGKEL